MKTIIKTTLSLILALCMVLPMTVLGAAPDYKDVPKSHWVYEYVMRLGREGIMHGMVEGEYFNKKGEVRSKELLTVLHRMTGEEAYEELVPIRYIEDSWYKDAILWAVNNSVAMLEFMYCSDDAPTSGLFSGFWGEGENYEVYLDLIDNPNAGPGNISFVIGNDGAETVITRSDVLAAFYRYTTKILEREVSSTGDISDYADSEKFPTTDGDRTLYNKAYDMYGSGFELIDIYGKDALTQIWLWAIDAGIIEGYPDGTLRPDATITRAEFAAMLTRFMDYVK